MLKSWHHSSLAVRDLDQAIAFYRKAFGFELTFEERDMTEQIQSIAGLPELSCDIAQLRTPRSDHVLELIAFKHDGAASEDIGERPLRPGSAHIGFYVDDLDATIARVEALGAVMIGEVTQFCDGRSVYYREPSGSFFEIEQQHEAAP